jgi:hypothetical protein
MSSILGSGDMKETAARRDNIGRKGSNAVTEITKNSNRKARTSAKLVPSRLVSVELRGLSLTALPSRIFYLLIS